MTPPFRPRRADAGPAAPFVAAGAARGAWDLWGTAGGLAWAARASLAEGVVRYRRTDDGAEGEPLPWRAFTRALAAAGGERPRVAGVRARWLATDGVRPLPWRAVLRFAAGRGPVALSADGSRAGLGWLWRGPVGDRLLVRAAHGFAACALGAWRAWRAFLGGAPPAVHRLTFDGGELPDPAAVPYAPLPPWRDPAPRALPPAPPPTPPPAPSAPARAARRPPAPPPAIDRYVAVPSAEAEGFWAIRDADTGRLFRGFGRREAIDRRIETLNRLTRIEAGLDAQLARLAEPAVF